MNKKKPVVLTHTQKDEIDKPNGRAIFKRRGEIRN
jgi:hypothetical protein